MKNKSTIIIILLFTALVSLFLVSCMSASPAEPDLPDYSETGGTLTQEKSVDEGDIVKTFDDYAYKLQTDGITIYKLDGGHIMLKYYYRFDCETATPVELYVTDKTVVAVYGTESLSSSKNFTQYGGVPDYSKLYIEIFENPSKTANSNEDAIDICDLKRYAFYVEAELLSSRLYQNTRKIYFAISQKITDDRYDDDLQNNNSSTENPYAFKYVENGKTKSYDEVKPVPGITQIGYSPTTAFLSVDLDDLDKSAVVSGYYGATLQDIYISETSIIPVFNSLKYEHNGGCYGYRNYVQMVHCFKLSPETLKIVDGVTLVDYEVYDRRAIKDYGDVIYIAATKRDGSGTTVISLDGKKFSHINSLEKIAPNEDVKSVTFGEENGKRYCYITTFLKIDPLFKIDVTNPEKMFTLGYMEIPGFATFMLNVGDYLLTLGYADANGRQYSPSDLKISLYDAKGDGLTPINEKIVQNVIYAEAIEDPRVIAVSGTTFAFSANVAKSLSSYNKSLTNAQSLFVFDIQEGKINLIGNVSNFYSGQDETVKYLNDYVEVEGVRATTDFGKYALSINRARFLDGYLYTFSDGMISSYKIIETADIEKTVATTYTERIFTHLTKTSLYRENRYIQ